MAAAGVSLAAFFPAASIGFVAGRLRSRRGQEPRGSGVGGRHARAVCITSAAFLHPPPWRRNFLQPPSRVARGRA
eukprot:11155589-Lingulodinium_polyedra.AAC.1